MTRPNKTRQIHIGNVLIGGGAPVSIQSMCNTDTANAAATLEQLKQLAQAGCQIGRIAVPNRNSLAALPEILEKTPIPLVADIHFDHELALGAIKAGIHAVRINPGNIPRPENVRKVAEAAGEADIPIRVGANSGSLPPGLYDSFLKEGHAPADAMSQALVKAVLGQAALLQQYGFKNIKVSLKSSSVPATVKAYRLFSERSDLPLHIGVTEAGTPTRGIIKSAVGIGTLLMEGIGDTFRVSLTADPVKEVHTAIAILEAAGLREARPELVACPTCGRTKIDLEGMADEVEHFIAGLKIQGLKTDLKKIAVMGCIVNGPGEAKDADLGLAGGLGKAVVFRNGETVATLPEKDAIDLLKKLIRERFH